MKDFTLVLGGGASKGYAHIGILKVLEQHNILPNLIIGTSMGALVGGLYASGKTAQQLEQLAMKVNSLGSFSLFSTLFKDSLLSISKIKRILKKEIGETTHDDCKIKFVSVATQLNTGKEKHFSSGNLFNSIMASIAVPGILPSVKIDNDIYCDGGVLNNLPEDVAKQLAPDSVIISVDVIGNYADQYENIKMKAINNMVNSTTLMTTNVVKNRPQ